MKEPQGSTCRVRVIGVEVGGTETGVEERRPEDTEDALRVSWRIKPWMWRPRFEVRFDILEVRDSEGVDDEVVDVDVGVGVDVGVDDVVVVELTSELASELTCECNNC